MTISAKIIQDSYNPVHDARITTLELEYPRFIHSEFMTHRVFSRNAASSRAIPVPKMLDLVKDNPATPSHWGKNKAGMQAVEEVSNVDGAKALWVEAAKSAASFSKVMHDMGLHKQVTNRITEPFQHMKVVLTSTCFNNFNNLRAHKDAQPEIKELADVITAVMRDSLPEVLCSNEWHVPYVTRKRVDNTMCYFDEFGNEISYKTALKISSSCCAQVSFRNADASQEKAEDIYNRLIESKPAHASPTEHQATPIAVDYLYNHELIAFFDLEGVTHVDRNSIPWSGNFHGWIQHRQLIKDNVVPY